MMYLEGLNYDIECYSYYDQHRYATRIQSDANFAIFIILFNNIISQIMILAFVLLKNRIYYLSIIFHNIIYNFERHIIDKFMQHKHNIYVVRAIYLQCDYKTENGEIHNSKTALWNSP